MSLQKTKGDLKHSTVTMEAQGLGIFSGIAMKEIPGKTR